MQISVCVIINPNPHLRKGFLIREISEEIAEIFICNLLHKWTDGAALKNIKCQTHAFHTCLIKAVQFILKISQWLGAVDTAGQNNQVTFSQKISWLLLKDSGIVLINSSLIIHWIGILCLNSHSLIRNSMQHKVRNLQYKLETHLSPQLSRKWEVKGRLSNCLITLWSTC